MVTVVLIVLSLLTMIVVSIFLCRYLPRLRRRPAPMLSPVGHRQFRAPILLAEQKQLRALVPLIEHRQFRMLASLALFAIVLLALFATSSGLTAGSMSYLGDNLGQVVMHNDAYPTTLRPAAHTVPLTASMRLVRVDSGARSQYGTNDQWQTWAYSSCSGIAMETVMNAYGRNLIASDVLQVEQNLGVWNVQLGLLRDDGVALTAAQFGFNTSSSHSLTVDQVVQIANQGTPVIVSVRDQLNYPGGHIFVVRGGNAQSVFIVDSSLLNIKQLTRAQFSAMWQGFSAVLTPRA